MPTAAVRPRDWAPDAPRDLAAPGRLLKGRARPDGSFASRLTLRATGKLWGFVIEHLKAKEKWGPKQMKLGTNAATGVLFLAEQLLPL